MTENTLVNVDKELKALANARKDSKRETACLFNLVIYLPDPNRRDYLRDIYRIIAKRFPCRVFFIESDPQAAKDTFAITVSEDAFVGYDIVNIKLSLDQLDRASFVVIPNLFPDVPIYLLWAHDPTTEKVLLPRLEPLAARLIFDSECAANLQNLSKHIIKHYQNMPLDMIDLNWAMISRWRDVFLSVFDCEERIQHLKHANNMVIEFYHSPGPCFKHSNISSIYFQGWIASRLGWKFISKENNHLQYHTGSNRIDIELKGISKEEIDLFPGAILNIEVICEDGHCYHFQRNIKEEKVVVQISSLDRCELPFSFQMHQLRSGQTFLRDVFFQPVGEHYFNMLKTIEVIEWHK